MRVIWTALKIERATVTAQNIESFAAAMPENVVIREGKPHLITDSTESEINVGDVVIKRSDGNVLHLFAESTATMTIEDLLAWAGERDK